MQTTFLYLGRFLKKLADDQYSSIFKGSIYHIKHMLIQPLTMGVDWPEIACLMEVSTMFNICRYCIFTWYGRDAINATKIQHLNLQGHSSLTPIYLSSYNINSGTLCEWDQETHTHNLGKAVLLNGGLRTVPHKNKHLTSHILVMCCDLVGSVGSQ